MIRILSTTHSTGEQAKKMVDRLHLGLGSHISHLVSIPEKVDFGLDDDYLSDWPLDSFPAYPKNTVLTLIQE